MPIALPSSRFRSRDEMPIEERLLRYSDIEVRREAADVIIGLRKALKHWQSEEARAALDRALKL